MGFEVPGTHGRPPATASTPRNPEPLSGSARASRQPSWPVTASRRLTAGGAIRPWRTALYRFGPELVVRLPDADDGVFGLVVEDDRRVLFGGFGEDLDAIAAGGFRVGVHAGYEVGV